MINPRLLIILFLTGCTMTTTNNIVLVPRPVVAAVAPSPCRRPADSPATTPPGLPLVHTTPIMPAMARDQHMAGCAGVLFRITASGIPTEAKVLVESPQGYGFGDSALTSLAGDKFKTGQSPTDWRYEIYTFRFGPPRA